MRHQHITYRAGRRLPMANVLKELGVKKGDRVTIYLPMIPEAAYAMLACARIGAIHSIVFGGFSPDALAAAHQRLRRQGGDHRRRRPARRPQGPLKANVDKALLHCPRRSASWSSAPAAGRLARRPRHLVHEDGRKVSRRLRASRKR
jgi:acyl-coenzyme A synthetase/AMP-(fatty) acid ligase